MRITMETSLIQTKIDICLSFPVSNNIVHFDQFLWYGEIYFIFNPFD